MEAERGSWFDWRDGAAYAPLLRADRSLFAWEWLRRDGDYRAAAEAALEGAGGEPRDDLAAAVFGLIAFEDPRLPVPHARPLWRADVHALVLPAARGEGASVADQFDLCRLAHFGRLIATEGAEHLLLSDGLRSIRLDSPPGAFSGGPACLRYVVEGLAAAAPRLLTLRRFLALCGSGHFSRLLHPDEPRARRWILMLRAWDGLAAGAGQREIAGELLSRSASSPRWRDRESSVRSQAQRLVKSACAIASGGYRAFLTAKQGR
ncbi:DNA -binding domain-containing protein [Sphingomonas sp. URHD0057]|uniref:DNA -binding domain-containing protein n=1 Tax=Sphingomonas sp. URHD0057 TaxID=1380389 RepID=UPI000ABBF75C|nr:DUF2285 domain-containing protein [Sphingomonas sp. URHD0057]